jgi:hypothetical protein
MWGCGLHQTVFSRTHVVFLCIPITMCIVCVQRNRRAVVSSLLVLTSIVGVSLFGPDCGVALADPCTCADVERAVVSLGLRDSETWKSGDYFYELLGSLCGCHTKFAWLAYVVTAVIVQRRLMSA